MNIRAKVRTYHATLMHYFRQGVSPVEVASAVAIGTFIAFLPVIGVHTAMAFFCAFLLRLNPVIILLGTQISNPFTFPFQIFVSAQAGNLLLHGSFLRLQFSRDVDWVHTYVIPLIAGSLVLGILCSALAFFGAYRILRRKPE